MRHTPFILRFAAGLAILIGLLLIVSMTRAQTSGSYDLTWNTIDGGGAMFSTGGGYELGGTIGQPEAGALSSATYTVNGGFWIEGPVLNQKVYLPLILK
jgi:hypothetical protein